MTVPGAEPLELIDTPAVAETVPAGAVAAGGGAVVVATVGAWGVDVEALDVAAVRVAVAVAACSAAGGSADGSAEGTEVALANVHWPAPCAEGSVEGIFFAGAGDFLL